MAHINTNSSVQNLAGVQNIYGDVIFQDGEPTRKRSGRDQDELDAEKVLDEKILASLAFPEMFDRRSGVELAYRQTCQWIFDLDQYKRWQAGPRGLLWIKGKPGSGKSTLMSHLHHSVWLEKPAENVRNVSLDFFFNARGESLQQTSVGMFRSLLNQILYQDPSVRSFARSVYQDKCASFGTFASSWSWQLPELKRLFADTVLACASDRQVVIFIDALDEAGEEAARDIANYLFEINDRIAKLNGTAKMCISCRHYPILSNTKALEIYVEHYNRKDIASYITGHLDFDDLSGSMSPYDHVNLVRTLVEMTNGVFQWARIVIPMVTKWLSEGDSINEILVGLSNIPDDLGAVYEHILMNVVDRRHGRKTLRLFQWVCLGQRPLSIAEMQYALSNEPAEVNAASMRYHQGAGTTVSAELMSRRIKSWSGGLLELVSHGSEALIEMRDEISDAICDTKKIQVIHQSVNDFILARGLSLLTALNTAGDSTVANAARVSQCSTMIQMCHSDLYRACLRCISNESLAESPDESALREAEFFDFFGTDFDGRTQGPCAESGVLFLKYSVRYVLVHAEKSGKWRSQDLEDETRLLHQSFPGWRKSCALPNGLAPLNNKSSVIAGTTVLHIAAAANLIDLVQHRLKCDDEVDETDEDGWTPLHAAAARGQLAAVKVLHESGASLHSRTNRGETPLLLAAGGGHADVFSFLAASGADLDATDHNSESALYTAVMGGMLAICKLCVDAGANVNASGGEYGNALQAAALHGSNVKIVQLLLKAGADIDARGGRYGSALQAGAVWDRSAKIVRLLIDAGADVNARGGMFGSALNAALRHENGHAIDLLEAAGARLP